MNDKKRIIHGNVWSDNLYGKLPPQAVDLEELVLGALLLEPKRAIPIVFPFLKPKHLYKESHQKILEAISEVYSSNTPVDIAIVTNRLRDNGNLELVGGAYAITMLTSLITSAANIEAHARIILQKFLQREMIRTGTELTRAGYESMDKAFEALTDANNVAESIEGTSDSIESILEQIDNYDNSGIQKSSGSRNIDKITDGFKGGLIYVIAGRPAMGKTSLALGLFNKSFMQQGLKGAIWSLEMPNVQLVEWIIQSYGLSKESIRTKSFNDYEKKTYERAKKDIIDSGIKILDTMPFEDAVFKFKQLKTQGLDYIIIDYLQNIITTERYANENAKLEDITRKLKNLAKMLDIFIIEISQLNREVENRDNRIPKLSDLRGSGGIEQAADVIMFPFRAEYYIDDDNKNSFTPDAVYKDINENVKGIMKVIIAKNKDGITGNTYLRYTTNVKSFTDYTKDVPMRPSDNF